MLRVYADTSVIGGCFDDEFSTPKMYNDVNLEHGYHVLTIITPVEVLASGNQTADEDV